MVIPPNACGNKDRRHLMQASRMHVHGGMISASQEACYKEGGVSDGCTAFFLELAGSL
jgi:hypothetical protein